MPKKRAPKPIETVVSERNYDVHVHTQCGGVHHFLWEEGAPTGKAPCPLDMVTKVKGPGARLRVTMKVEVLSAGRVAKPFHPKDGHTCGTKNAKHMHVMTPSYLSGSPYCEFTRDRPYDWPKSHWWVHANHRDIWRANCLKCLRRARKDYTGALRTLIDERIAELSTTKGRKTR